MKKTKFLFAVLTWLALLTGTGFAISRFALPNPFYSRTFYLPKTMHPMLLPTRSSIPTARIEAPRAPAGGCNAKEGTAFVTATVLAAGLGAALFLSAGLWKDARDHIAAENSPAGSPVDWNR